jgi:hypothetical protein
MVNVSEKHIVSIFIAEVETVCFYEPTDYFFSLLWIRPIGLFQFRITYEIMNHQHTVGLLGRVISSSQGLYVHRTTQQRQTRTNTRALSGIRTRDPV